MIDDDDIRNAPMNGLIRLAISLGIEVKVRQDETPGQHRWRIGRAVQRAEKRIAKMPKKNRK